MYEIEIKRWDWRFLTLKQIAEITDMNLETLERYEDEGMVFNYLPEDFK
jgi:hypothetical protein|tara:strand:- start:327 stop:473 length:147 start_codon:yes stop_codon:yes gene_type:complete